MYTRFSHARRALSYFARVGCISNGPTTSSRWEHYRPAWRLRCGPTANAAAAALACLAVLSTDDSVCEQDNVVWVDVHGKKVAVHDKEVDPSEEAPQSGALKPNRRYYPYVIIGYGVAGKAALHALLERDPGAKVLVVDARPDDSPTPEARPDASPTINSGHTGERGRDSDAGTTPMPNAGRVEFARSVRATALDADRGMVTLSSSRPQREPADGGDAPAVEEVNFGRCLLALGSRPRPPPPGFIDPAARENVVLLGSHGGVDREKLRQEVDAGRAVTIVGSSWQALELACWLQEGRITSAGKTWGGPCRMVFSDYAPLDHMLPRYLSVALIRRLNNKRIKTIGHSSLRWVGSPNRYIPTPAPEPSQPVALSTNSAPGRERGSLGLEAESDGSLHDEADALQLSSLPSTSQTGESPGPAQVQGDERAQEDQQSAQVGQKRQPRRLQVMTAHSFDHLDTATHSTDTVVLAGVDVAPLGMTLDVHASDKAGRDIAGTFAGRKRAGTLEVDLRRGAVVVNAELAASSRVWAAGDVACFPSQAYGGRRLVLRTADHAHHSGKIAGSNMAAAAGAAGAAAGQTEGGRRYCHSPAFVGEAPLAGVRVAMVGDCNAALPTHGFWWLNSATGLSKGLVSRRTQGATTSRDRDEKHSATGVTLRSRKTVRKEFTPVFGTGVVFYTSGAEVKGAMLWGFPGEATAAAAMGQTGFPTEGGGREDSPADAAALISARALDLLRTIMERSANMDADLSDERVMQAWIQGLSDAAMRVARETGLGHLQPTRRSVPGRVTSSTRRPAGTRDELMYQNTSKTSSATRRLKAAYAARFRGVSPEGYPSSSPGGTDEVEFDPEMVEFFGYGSGSFGEQEVDAADSGSL